MQNVVLVLLSVLIIIVIAIVFVGYKKLSSFRVQISKLQLDVLSLRNFIDERLLSGGSSPMVGLTHPGPMNMHPTMVPANTSHLEPTNEEPVVEEVTEEESTEEETVTDDSDEDEALNQVVCRLDVAHTRTALALGAPLYAWSSKRDSPAHRLGGRHACLSVVIREERGRVWREAEACGLVMCV